MPNKSYGCLNLGDAYKSNKEYEKSLKFYTKALKDPSCENLALFKRAWLLYQINNYDDSEKDFKKILESDPENVKAYFYLGKINLKL